MPRQTISRKRRVALDDNKPCKEQIATAEQKLTEIALAKQFEIPIGIPCAARTGGMVAVDLVVLVDSSDSMTDEAIALIHLAQQSIRCALDSCQNDCHVIWLGLEGTWEGTAVTQTCRDYLIANDVSESNLRSRRRGSVKNQGAQEDSARAIIDLANYFDWRPYAWRLILLLGDEPLEGGLPYNGADIRAANEAILAARLQKIRIFSYAGSGKNGKTADDVVQQSFARMARETNGKTYTAPMDNLSPFAHDLAQIVCGSPQRNNSVVIPPDIGLCFQIHWGDGDQDRIESEDYETLYLVAHNPYLNVTFSDVTVTAITLHYIHDGKVVRLPRAEYTHEPLADLTPRSMVSFGVLPPARLGNPTQVARQLVLGTFRTPPGPYQIHIEYQYGIKFQQFYRDFALLQVDPHQRL